MATQINRKAIDHVIRHNLARLRKPGVMTVRPGFKLTGGWITNKPAIVATVNRKLDGLPPSQMLPHEIDDIPVDVREATGLQRLRQVDPQAHSLIVAHGRNELHEPSWPLERNVSDGSLVPPVQKKPLNSKGTTTPKPQVKYSAPAGKPLAAVTRTMTITAAASPDTGYQVLTNFLAGTKSSLSVAMYDFTSADLLTAMTKAIKAGSKPFAMVLDHPPRNPTANQPDDVTSADLLTADSNARVNWALTRNDPKVSAWIYPSAYHIKVIVRDGASFWISSGNLNVSNEPNFDAHDPKRGSLATADRDWHLIVMDNGLAALYEAYIQHDFAVATQYQTSGNLAVRAKIQAAQKKHALAQSQSTIIRNPPKPAPPSNFPQRLFDKIQVTVQPLLTPDPGQRTTLYVEKVLELIQSATQRIYMQTQYIHVSNKPEDKDFMALVDVLAGAYKRGLDVRLITSQYENTPQWVEKLKEHDLDSVLRIQNRVHNKGIVVDSKVLMVSSENWSGDGTLRNRDAGLIIHNAEIAQYFESIFLDDWTKRAVQKVVDASHPASGGKQTMLPTRAGQRSSP
jgi:phospholipase D-like protein